MAVIRMEDWAGVRSCVIAQLCAKYTCIDGNRRTQNSYESSEENLLGNPPAAALTVSWT
jgi:hypothetical protein